MKFKLGHLYVVDYGDHWSNENTYRSANTDGKEFILRQRGVAVFETDREVVIEHHTYLSDGPDKRGDRHGIMKSAIRRVQHLGKEK